MIRLVALICALLCAPTIIYAQDNNKTLADVRQDLNILYVEVLKLRRELSTTQTSSMISSNEASVLERLDGMEQELRRLTSETENLEFRVSNIVSDGTNRVRDLEYRLVELEGGDLSKIDYATTLGGDLEISSEINVEENSGPELAIGEKYNFYGYDYMINDYCGFSFDLYLNMIKEKGVNKLQKRFISFIKFLALLSGNKSR